MLHDGKIILHEDTDVLLGDYALLKLDDTQYHTLDKQYLLRSKKSLSDIAVSQTKNSII